MKKYSISLAILTGTLIICCGNAGTPLMWATMIHLVIGNAIIGLFEGLLIGKVFHLHKGKAVATFIVANYFSAWAGGIGIALLSSLLSLDLYSGRWFLWLSAALFLVVTILLEWPVIALLFRRTDCCWKRSYKASLLAQCASYLVIAAWYLLASGVDLYTRARVDTSLSFVSNTNAMLYFIGTDGNAYKQRLGRNKPEVIAQMSSSNRNDRLMLVPSSVEGQWDLAVRLETGHRSVITNVLLRACTTNGAQSGGGWAGKAGIRNEGNWFNFGPAADLRPITDRIWQVRTGFWAIEGLTLRNTNTAERLHLSLETPFLQWYARNASVLPEDEVVFQLGEQICIFDREQRRIGMVARGKGPVVILEDTKN